MSLPLNYVRMVVEDNIYEVADLVTLLELSIEDVLDRFPDKLREHAHKFVEGEVENEGWEDYSQETWYGRSEEQEYEEEDEEFDE